MRKKIPSFAPECMSEHYYRPQTLYNTVNRKTASVHVCAVGGCCATCVYSGWVLCYTCVQWVDVVLHVCAVGGCCATCVYSGWVLCYTCVQWVGVVLHVMMISV